MVGVDTTCPCGKGESYGSSGGRTGARGAGAGAGVGAGVGAREGEGEPYRPFVKSSPQVDKYVLFFPATWLRSPISLHPHGQLYKYYIKKLLRKKKNIFLWV